MHGTVYQNVMKSVYKQFLSTDYAKQHISLAEELHRAEQFESTQMTDEDSDQTGETRNHSARAHAITNTYSHVQVG